MALKLFYIFLTLHLGQYLASPAYADEVLDTKQLLKENKPEQIYKILTTREFYHMGEPGYDLLLARTALQLGYPHEAIFAYERVLINQPGNNLAQVELAIAYYQIEELETSRQLFSAALQSSPPGNIRQNIHHYIERIDEKIGSRKHSLRGILTLKQGWDSNINSATNESEIELSIGTYRPTDGVDKETSDSFTEISNRLHYNYNFNINSNFFSGAGYTNRDNNNKQFDTQTADANIGYSHLTAIGKISIPLSYQTMWLDEKQLRKVFSISTTLNRTSSDSFSAYNLQYGEIRNPYKTPLDVDFVAASIAFGFSNKKSGFNQQYALFYGDETATNNLYKFNAREYWGAQILFPVQISQRHSITPKVVYQISKYHQKPWIFTNKRKDDYTHYELAWRWHITRDWTLLSQAGHTESNSSVPLYTYTRTTLFTRINYSY